MKKTLLGILMVLLIGLLVAGCSSSTPTADDTTEDYPASTSTDAIEPPVSNVKDGTGLAGTWELSEMAEGGEFEMVLALNDDDTFQLYLNGEAPGFMSATFKTLLDGTYTDKDDQLTLKFDDPTEASIELNLNSYVFNYSLDGDSLTLDNEGTTYDMHRVS